MLPTPINKLEELQTEMFGIPVLIEDAGDFTIYPIRYSGSYAVLVKLPDSRGRVKLKIRNKIMTFNKPKLKKLCT